MAQNPLAKFGVTDAEIAAAIRSSGEVRAEKKRVAQRMVEHAKSISPVETGSYAAKWKVEERRNGRVVVVNRSNRAHLIEYGTGPDSKGGERYVPKAGVVLGENTPTPAFAIGEKTANAFGGTLGGVEVEK